MSEKNEKQQEMQQKLIILQLLQRRLEEMKQQEALIQNKMAELAVTQEGLEGIGKAAKKNDILVPIGSGMFTYATVTDTEQVIVDVGSGVMVEKDLKAADRFIEERKREIEGLEKELEKESGDLAEKITQLAEEIQASQQGQE